MSHTHRHLLLLWSFYQVIRKLRSFEPQKTQSANKRFLILSTKMAQDYYNMSKTHPFNERHFPQRRFGCKGTTFFFYNQTI